MELKKIELLSCAKISALFGILYGLISGIVVAIASKYPEVAQQMGIIATLGAKSVVILPVLNGAIYFLLGIIGAFLYNIFTGWVGGIKLEFSEKDKKK